MNNKWMKRFAKMMTVGFSIGDDAKNVDELINKYHPFAFSSAANPLFWSAFKLGIDFLINFFMSLAKNFSINIIFLAIFLLFEIVTSPNLVIESNKLFSALNESLAASFVLFALFLALRV